VVEKEKPGYSHASIGAVHVYVSTAVRSKLKLEGLSREVVRRVQHMRKEMGLEFGEPIVVEYVTSPEIEQAISAYEANILRDTNASSLTSRPSVDGGRKWTINKMPFEASVRRP
jgi:isoleucyl-tRNA synthetase